jgi:dihydroorotate dehydrogenase
MEEYNKEAGSEITREVQETGVDGFELNLSCPHGLPERKMGMAWGENPDIVARWWAGSRRSRRSRCGPR